MRWVIALALVACGGARAARRGDVREPLTLGGGAALEAALQQSAEVEPEPQPHVRSLTTGPEGRGVPNGVSGRGRVIVVSATTDDPTYGYAPTNPVKVGGIAGYPEPQYLSGLWGPEGQPIAYERLGSCCQEVAGHLLDKFAVSWEGLERPVILYLDMYEEGPLRVPVGMRGSP